MKHAPLFLLLVLLAACNDDSSSGGGGCETNRDCAGAELCIDGRCQLECDRREDCALDEICVENRCRSPRDPCVIPQDCAPFGWECDVRQGVCVPPGGVTCPATPCRNGTVCVGGACVVDTGDHDQGPPPWDGGTRDGSVRDAEPPPADMRRPPPDMRPPPPDMDRPPPPDMGAPPPPDMGVIRGDKQYGEPCNCPGECESGLCLGDPYYQGPEAQRPGTCTRVCENDGACPRLDRCVRAQVPPGKRGCPPADNGLEVGDIVNICAPNETGRPCNVQDPSDCLIDGLCVQPPNPIPGVVPVQAACAARCLNDVKCPPGFHCGGIQTPQGPAQGCISDVVAINQCPDGDFRTCGGTCRVPAGFNEADITFCISWTPDGMPGFCSCTCAAQADCPAGFACSPVPGFDSGDARRPKICLPLSGYTCPGGGFEPCLSQTCAGQADGEVFERCAAPCDGHHDCPTGYACQAFGADGNYCVPSL